ncbi:MAG: ABC transporter permease, partial [Longimicrobiales bacterium]
MRRHLHVALVRLREYFRRSQVDAEREEEFAFHLEMQTAHNRRAGMSEEEARRAALLTFGGVERFREQTRDARGIVAVENILRDARFAVRRLRRSPSFSLGVIATLAVGTSAVVAIGTLVYGVLLRPLPYAEPHELVHVTFRTPGLDDGREHAHSHATYIHFRDAAGSFTAIGAYHVNNSVNFTDGDDPARVTAVMITPTAIAALGVVPALGRLFGEADARMTGTIPVLIGHDLWLQRYGGDPSIIDRVVEINRSPRRVLGVLPPGFGFPVPSAAVYFPIDVQLERATLNSRYLDVVARLRPGVSADAAEVELRTLIERLPLRFPEITAAAVAGSGARAQVQSLRDAIVAPVREHLQMLALTMVFVLLIATANVANLFLLRSERLRHEIAITTALGGGTVALVRRFMTEGAVLGFAAGVMALPIVLTALASGFGVSVREIPRLHEITPGVGPAAALLLIATLLGAVVALFPFARARRVRIEHNLRSAAPGVIGGGWKRVQQGLAVSQVAVAIALVLSAT